MSVRVLWDVGAKDFIFHLGITICINDTLDIQYFLTYLHLLLTPHGHLEAFECLFPDAMNVFR